MWAEPEGWRVDSWTASNSLDHLVLSNHRLRPPPCPAVHLADTAAAVRRAQLAMVTRGPVVS